MAEQKSKTTWVKEIVIDSYLIWTIDCNGTRYNSNIMSDISVTGYTQNRITIRLGLSSKVSSMQAGAVYADNFKISFK